MDSSKSQFDYEAILEACGIQDVTVKRALEETSDSAAKFREAIDNLKKLTAEMNEKDTKLTDMKLTQKKNLHKLKNITNKISTVNSQRKLVQDDITSLRIERERQLDDFDKHMNAMDEQLKALYSQFEGETLAGLIRDVDNKLLYYRDIENQLHKRFDELIKSQLDLKEYGRLSILKSITDSYAHPQNIDEIEREIADTRKNIQFLEAEYKKKAELLQKYD